MNARIPVLFLTMEFAPVNTTGNFRALKFVKYLREFGYEPVVVTFKEDEGATYFNAKLDHGLLKEIPDDLSVYRIHCDDGKRFYKNRLRSFMTIYFSIKDTFARRWRKHLFREIGTIVGKHKPQMIFTTLPPFSSGMLAVELKRMFNLPLIVDMRDFWAMWGSTPFGSKLHFSLTKQEERTIFTEAAAVIGVTPQLVSTFRKTHPDIPLDRFHLIPNGFDKVISEDNTYEYVSKKPVTVIGYVGAFYYYPDRRDDIFKPWWKKRIHKILQYVPRKEDWLYRSPYFCLKAVRALLDKYPQFADKIRLEFVGHKPAWFDAMVAEFDLAKLVTSHGFVSYQKSRELQQGFDLILATSEKVPGDEHYCLPSKVFDYVGDNKPVLGFVTDGVQKEFIEKSGVGVICNPDDIPASVETMKELLLHGGTFTINSAYLSTYHRREIARKLADVFSQVNKSNIHIN